MYDPELYRDHAEVERWKERDPLPRLAERLRTDGVLSDDDLFRFEAEVAEEIDAAIAGAEAGTWEPVEDLERFVYSEDRP
jgi:TPP-dependent pyruvate/acetoin dehydrogenase alpha subunit